MVEIPTRLDVAYSQIAVFESTVEHPFSMWTEKHVSQGFAWRPESASFRTIEEVGPHALEVVITKDDMEISEGASRVIEVPFDVPSSGEIEVASIYDGRSFNIPPKNYTLRFECFPASNVNIGKIRLVFLSGRPPEFRLLRTDSDIQGGELLISASPA